jgi:hypothetical protein
MRKIPGGYDPGTEPGPLLRYLTAQDRRTLETIEETSLSRERHNVGRDIFSLTPTHRKIHLRVRTNERSHKIILVESVFATNYFKGRRVCDDAPRTSANDVTGRTSILSYMPATLNVPSERRSRYKQQRDASSKTKSTTLHKVLRSYSGQRSVSCVDGNRRNVPTDVRFLGHARLAANTL